MQAQDLMDLSDRARLELTLTTRETIIKTLMADGKVPSDKTSCEMLISALDGMDRTVLAKAKLKSEDDSARNQQQTAKMVAEVLTKVTIQAGRRTGPVSLPNDIKLNNPVKGEMDIGIQTITYDEIMNY